MPLPDGTATPGETALFLAFFASMDGELQPEQQIDVSIIDYITLEPGVMIFRFDTKEQADSFMSFCSAYPWRLEQQGELDIKLTFPRE